MPPSGFVRFPCHFQVNWPPHSDALDRPTYCRKAAAGPAWAQLRASPAFCHSHTNWSFHGDGSASRPGDVSSGLLLETNGYSKPVVFIQGLGGKCVLQGWGTPTPTLGSHQGRGTAGIPRLQGQRWRGDRGCRVGHLRTSPKMTPCGHVQSKPQAPGRTQEEQIASEK